MSNIIVMFENEDKELNMSLYDFIDEQYRKKTPIAVCHVTEKEYNNMKKQVRLGCLYERLPRITNSDDMEYNKFRYVVVYDSIENNLLISDYDNPKKIGNYILDYDGIHYNPKGYQIPYINTIRFGQSCRLKVYTTETYNNIVEHYEVKLNVENKIQEKTQELIELIGKSCKTCNSECCGGPGGRACDRWSHIIY